MLMYWFGVLMINFLPLIRAEMVSNAASLAEKTSIAMVVILDP